MSPLEHYFGQLRSKDAMAPVARKENGPLTAFEALNYSNCRVQWAPVHCTCCTNGSYALGFGHLHVFGTNQSRCPYTAAFSRHLAAPVLGPSTVVVHVASLPVKVWTYTMN